MRARLPEMRLYQGGDGAAEKAEAGAGRKDGALEKGHTGRRMIEKRICQDCGGEFMGGDRALFCPECRNKHKTRRVTKICTTCGAEYVSTVKSMFCPECRKREYGRRKNDAWKTILRREGRPMEEGTQKNAENRKKKRCRSCYYHGDMAGCISCEYLLVTGKKRPCPPEDEKEGVRCGAYIEMKEGVGKYGERKLVDV